MDARPDAPQIDHDVGVVGAGFAGLAAGVALLDAGRTSLVIFERALELGGVWRDNVYPGCACDIRSHLYSISSRPNPDWPSSYAAQADILAYLKRTAERSGLDRRIRLGVSIVEARWLERHGCWRLTAGDGGLIHVRSLILATGPLNRPSLPEAPGLDRFAGTYVHSSAWGGSPDLAGKRVAVVGTGASAVQIVPNIAPVVGKLTVFQRSAPWVLPRMDRRTSAAERWLFRRFPAAQAAARAAIFWALEGVGAAFFGHALIHRALTAVALGKLRREVADPGVRAALTPDHALGCKRPTVSDDFYPAFNRPNVALVTTPIAEITAEGVRTADGALHEVDHIVFATGFVVAEADGFLPVVGLGGRVLGEEWARSGAQAHRGISVSGYPNLALLLGPNSGLSYSSVIHVVESQMAYVLQALDARDHAGPRAALDVRPQAQAVYNGTIQQQLAGSVWASGCRSWYLDRTGANRVIYPGAAYAYRRMTARFDREAYVVVQP